MTRTSAVVGALLLASGALVLPGCGQAAQESVEKSLEQRTGADADIDDERVGLTDQDGDEFSVGSPVELPESWPEVVPTPAGTLVFASGSVTESAASAVWDTDGSPADSLEAFEAQLAAAGFTAVQTSNSEFGHTATYTGNGYSLIIGAGTGTGAGTSLSLSVLPTN